MTATSVMASLVFGSLLTEKITKNISSLPVVVDRLECLSVLVLFIFLFLWSIFSILFIIIERMFLATFNIHNLISHDDIVSSLQNLWGSFLQRGGFWGRLNGNSGHILSCYCFNNGDSLQRSGKGRGSQLSELDGTSGSEEGGQADGEGDYDLFIEHLF